IVGDRRCWSDSNHPNEYGNRYVADTIEPGLTELLGEQPLPIRKPTLETTRDFWQEAVALASDHLAVVDGDRRLTYGEANAMVEQLAANIAAATGVSRPTVAVYLPNGLEYYLIYWATQRLGGVIVPLNTWLKEESLAGIFRMVQPDILFVRGPQDEFAVRAGQGMPVYATEHADDEPLLPSPPPLGREEGAPGTTDEIKHLPSPFLPREGGQGVRSIRPYTELLQTAPPAPEAPLTGDDLSIIMHTSGTTSTPKGAMMRHADLMFNVAAAINAHDFSTTDVHLLVNPMFHCTALYSSLPTAAYQKTPVIILPTTAPEELMAVVERERITTFLSIPSVFQKILTLPDLARYDASALRVMAYAGSPMPVATIRELRRRFPDVALHNFFGLTETISMTHVLRNTDLEAHPDSIGRLLPFVEAMVVDEDNQPMPPGEPGELLFAREEIIPGYFQQPERLQEALVELHGRTWFRTGDLAAVDAEGFFTVKGRKKDMIIVGGENVFAAEVEAVLLTHEKIREAAVKGIPATGVRSYLGELVKAYIVPHDASLTELELKKHCYERLPSYKVPAFFAFLDALPRNPSGKVVKDELP
ncbi:MAG TPA: class I adenylate-forming enzyme family protein, partial [Armatimonadota bacterium]